MALRSLKDLIPQETRQRFTGWHLVLPLLGSLVVIGITTVVLIFYTAPLKALGSWGYPGVFIVMMVNSMTVFFPAFGQAFLIAAAQTLNPWLLGIVGGIGSAIGELTAYYLGKSGGRMLIGRKLYDHYRQRSGVRGNFLGPMVLIFAATPLPVDLVGVVAGAVHYPVSRFLGWMTVGKIISTTALAFAGYYAIDWIQSIFNLGR